MPVQIAPIARESLLDQAVPSLQVGGILGVVGATTAAIIGHRAVFATTVGVQCFYLGTSTFYVRHALLTASRRSRTNRLELGCSGVAGALSGALSGVLNKSSLVRPALLAGTISLAAQAAFHGFRDGQSALSEDKSWVDRLATILPLQTLSDEQYDSMLKDKLTRINMEISILDEQIANLKQRDIGSGQRNKS